MLRQLALLQSLMNRKVRARAAIDIKRLVASGQILVLAFAVFSVLAAWLVWLIITDWIVYGVNWLEVCGLLMAQVVLGLAIKPYFQSLLELRSLPTCGWAIVVAEMLTIVRFYALWFAFVVAAVCWACTQSFTSDSIVRSLQVMIYSVVVLWLIIKPVAVFSIILVSANLVSVLVIGLSIVSSSFVFTFSLLLNVLLIAAVSRREVRGGCGWAVTLKGVWSVFFAIPKTRWAEFLVRLVLLGVAIYISIVLIIQASAEVRAPMLIAAAALFGVLVGDMVHIGQAYLDDRSELVASLPLSTWQQNLIYFSWPAFLVSLANVMLAGASALAVPPDVSWFMAMPVSLMASLCILVAAFAYPGQGAFMGCVVTILMARLSQYIL